MSKNPTHGWTRHGLPVHAKAVDHLPTDTAYQRFNKKAATLITKGVGSMTCAYLFGLIALISLPSVIKTHNIQAIVAWVAQTFLQLVLLSIIIVGTNLLGVASDARAAKTFEDVEVLLDRLDTHTQGGITEVLDAVAALKSPAKPPGELHSTP